MKKIKRWVYILMCVAMIMPLTKVEAKNSKDYWPKANVDITAGAAILMDVDTGAILYGKKIDKTFYPASITKILTTLIAIENSSMDEIVTFSEDAIYKTEGSGIWRDIGEQMTMEQCLYAVMLESANECAYAVAEHIAGSIPAFSEMMNEKIKELGCTVSHFNNPHGLPDENHFVTAKEMAIIARAAFQNETFRLLCGTKKYTIPPTNKHSEPTYLKNHHKMLNAHEGVTKYLYDYCVGGKTGYTVAAGNTLVTYAQKDGMTLVVVILGGSTPAYWNETKSLFEFGFENFNMYNVSEKLKSDENNDENKYDSLNTNEPYAEIDPQAKIILPKTVEFNKADMQIKYDALPEGVLAQFAFSYGTHDIGTANIIRTNAEISESQNNVSSANDLVLSDHNDDQNENSTETEAYSWKEKLRSFFFKMSDEINEKGAVKFYIILSIIVILSVLFIVIVIKMIRNNSHKIRRKIAMRRNQKWENKQYTIIPDSKKRRKKWF